MFRRILQISENFRLRYTFSSEINIFNQNPSSGFSIINSFRLCKRFILKMSIFHTKLFNFKDHTFFNNLRFLILLAFLTQIDIFTSLNKLDFVTFLLLEIVIFN